MPLRRSVSLLLAFVVIGGAPAAGTIAGAPATSGASAGGWTVRSLGSLGKRSWAADVNNTGEVAGMINLDGRDCIHPFLWRNGRMEDLMPKQWPCGEGEYPRWALGTAINDRGQVAGILIANTLAEDNWPFLWESGTFVEGPYLSCGDSFPHVDVVGLNRLGQIIAVVEEEKLDDFGFVCAKSVRIESGTKQTALGSLGRPFTWATAINDRGQIVGHSTTKARAEHAFIWENGKMTDLGTLGGKTSYATAINERGQVVGVSSISTGADHAFLWQNGKMRNLGTLGGRTSGATGINERGQVVGTSDTRSGSRHAFLWENGKMRDLGVLTSPSQEVGINERGQVIGLSGGRGWGWERGRRTVLPGLPGATATGATAINDNGWIVGWSLGRNGQMRAVIWTRSG